MPQTVHHRPRRRSIDAPKTPPTPVGVRRRLQGLIAMGWSYSSVADHLHVSKRRLSQILEGDPCPDRLIEAAVATYDLLLARGVLPDEPAINGMRGWARWRGWVPPDAWSGRSIDKPSARPIKPRVGALIEDIEWMAATGETWAGACHRVQMSQDTLRAVLRRAGRDDLWQRLAAAAA